METEKNRRANSRNNNKCTKRKYKTKRKVKNVLRNMKRSGREEIRFYWCRDCIAYHLTSRKRILIWENEDEY